MSQTSRASPGRAVPPRARGAAAFRALPVALDVSPEGEPVSRSSPPAGLAEDRASGPSRGAVRLGPLGDTIGFHLRLAQEASFAAFARRSAGANRAGQPVGALKPGRFAMLAMIHENPGLSQTALGAAVGRDKSTLTPALVELERRGLVRRDRGADRRSYALSLTPAGEAALEALGRHAALHDRLLDRLVGAENRDAFLDTLRRLIAGLDTDGH